MAQKFCATPHTCMSRYWISAVACHYSCLLHLCFDKLDKSNFYNITHAIYETCKSRMTNDQGQSFQIITKEITVLVLFASKPQDSWFFPSRHADVACRPGEFEIANSNNVSRGFQSMLTNKCLFWVPPPSFYCHYSSGSKAKNFIEY